MIFLFVVQDSSIILNSKLGTITPCYIPLLYPLILVGFEAMSTICVDRFKMSRLWQLISKHPQLLLLTSMHGSQLCNILLNFHVLHVSVNPCNLYIQLDLVSYPMFQHQITSSSFTSCFCFHPSLSSQNQEWE